MKQILIILCVFFYNTFLNAQVIPTFETNYYIYGKELKKLDKRFKKDKEYRKAKYIVIKIFNPANEVFYFREYSQSLILDKEELIFDDSNFPIISVGSFFGSKSVTISPNQSKYFVIGLIESSKKKLIRSKVVIGYSMKKIPSPNDLLQTTLEIDVQKLKPFCTQ